MLSIPVAAARKNAEARIRCDPHRRTSSILAHSPQGSVAGWRSGSEGESRRVESELITHIGELDERRLSGVAKLAPHLTEGYLAEHDYGREAMERHRCSGSRARENVETQGRIRRTHAKVPLKVYFRGTYIKKRKHSVPYAAIISLHLSAFRSAREPFAVIPTGYPRIQPKF